MTQKNRNSDLDAAERRERWDEALFGTETDGWDYGQWLVAVLEHTFDAIEGFFGTDAAAAPLLELVAQAASDEGYGEPADWRNALETIGINALVSWPISQVFRELGLYGRYGVLLEDVTAEEGEAHLALLLERAEAFILAFDIESVAGRNNVLERIVNLARSRWNLDRLEGEVDPHSLALLGDVSEGRVRNMMSGSNREFENVGGRVAASSALAWLEKRPEFFNSIWNGPGPEEAPIEPLREVTFVPAAKDGSMFHPGLMRNGHYQIGPKGSETTHADYYEALQALQAMGSEARWRRPNPTGNWGIVKVETWMPLERAQLESGQVAR